MDARRRAQRRPRACEEAGHRLRTGVRWAGSTGKIDTNTTFESDRLPQRLSAIHAGGAAANMALVDVIKRIAERKGATPAQLALAWLLARKPSIVPIPVRRNRITSRGKPRGRGRGADRGGSSGRSKRHSPRSRFKANGCRKPCLKLLQSLKASLATPTPGAPTSCIIKRGTERLRRG